MKKKPLSKEQLADACRLKHIFNLKKKMLGISQEAVAFELGVGQSAVNQLLNGVNALNVSNASAFARMLKVPVGAFSPSLAKKIEQLAGALKPDQDPMTQWPGSMIPVVGQVWLNKNGTMETVEFRLGWLQVYSPDKNAYGLKVKGDSMWPRLHPGEYVIIEPNTSVCTGDEVFIRTKDGQNMFKIMNKTRQGDFQFFSINSNHYPVTLSPDQIEHMHFISAIVKHTHYIDQYDTPDTNINMAQNTDENRGQV